MIVGGIEHYRRSVGVCHGCGKELVGTELGKVGQEIDRRIRSGWRLAAKPMEPPVILRTVAGGAKPTLVPHEKLVVHRGRVNGLAKLEELLGARFGHRDEVHIAI